MTALRLGLRSARLCQLAVALLAAGACAASPIAAATPGAKGGGVASPARTVSPSPPGAKGGSPPPIPGVPVASVRCVGQGGAAMVLVGRAIYDVTDPVHPKLVCTFVNTVAHLFTGDTFEYLRETGDANGRGTEVVLRSIGSGNERVVAGWPLSLLEGPFGMTDAWTPDGNTAAAAVASTDAAGDPWVEIWLFTEPNKILLYSFAQPLTDCVCRFGVPPPTLVFSADGQYLVVGWPVGKGATPLKVFRVADHVQVGALDPGDTTALWDRTGHVLYASGASAPLGYWTPEGGLRPLLHGPALPYMPGLSPNGQDIAYTGYASAGDQSNLRVYDYNIPMAYTRVLDDQPRSEVTFVKESWVWYFGEVPCADCPGESAANGPLYALDVTHGIKLQVVFAAGESPTDLRSGWSPGQFWPNS
jgi:hypothetical protein